jgi:hypothetical protein
MTLIICGCKIQSSFFLLGKEVKGRTGLLLKQHLSDKTFQVDEISHTRVTYLHEHVVGMIFVNLVF